MGLFVKGSKNPMTETSTPKFVEEIIIEVMLIDKVIELFHTMAIVSLNMGNLNLEVNSLRNRLGHR
jgi:CRISPR/Cas system-associated protein Cas7 (RAMP superfamily)